VTVTSTDNSVEWFSVVSVWSSVITDQRERDSERQREREILSLTTHLLHSLTDNWLTPSELTAMFLSLHQQPRVVAVLFLNWTLYETVNIETVNSCRLLLLDVSETGIKANPILAPGCVWGNLFVCVSSRVSEWQHYTVLGLLGLWLYSTKSVWWFQWHRTSSMAD